MLKNGGYVFFAMINNIIMIGGPVAIAVTLNNYWFLFTWILTLAHTIRTRDDVKRKDKHCECNENQNHDGK